MFLSFLVHTKTLPHPRHNNHIMDARARDDQMIGKGYMPSPSPAPPLDGSYYNMNSDRYLSYPPMVNNTLLLPMHNSSTIKYNNNSSTTPTYTINNSSINYNNRY